MPEVIESLDVQTRNNRIAEMLSAKEKQGFAYGELNSYLHKLATDNDVTFYTIRNIYYNHVKNQIPEEAKEDLDDNLIETFDVNGEPVRLVQSDNKPYFVTRDVCKSVQIDRTNPLVKKGMPEKYKSIASVKSTYGYVRTSIISPEGVIEFLHYINNNHKIENIRNKAMDFLVKMKDLGFEHEVNNVVMETGNNTKPNSVPQETKSESKSELYKPRLDSSLSTIKDTKEVTEPDYRHGDLIKVRVIHIVPYGVLVETLDDFNIQGLIHIKNVRNGYVPDLNMYFDVDDELEVMVTRFDRPSKRLNLSTLDLKLPLKTEQQDIETANEFSKVIQEEPEDEGEYNTLLASKLGPLKEKLTLSTKPVEPVATKTVIPERKQTSNSLKSYIEKKTPVYAKNEYQPIPEQPKNVAYKESPPVSSDLPVDKLFELYIQGDKELEKIVSILNKKVGALTPSARAKLLDILNRDDVTLVDFIMSLSGTISNFQADLGLILLKEIENNLSDGL